VPGLQASLNGTQPAESNPPKEGIRVRRSALKRKPRPRKQPDELEAMAAFKVAALAQGCCQVCGGPADVAHHVLHRQAVAREGGDIWAPANAMALCDADHDAHHNRQRPIPYSAVPPDAWDFANELLGRDGAEAYFARYYQPRRVVGY
jgi:5-methylcytosine-specific restriction endonuclease McrA